jgi:hypothetical protein
MYPETFPKTSRIRFEFPEREGLPPLKFWWYDGNPNEAFKPIRPPAEVVKEIILLGCVALRLGEGVRMDWDGPNMKSTNLPDAERFVRRHNRAGWELANVESG